MSRRARLAVAATLAAIALHPLLYAGMFAGDAEIHLVFGESAATGRFFEFNPGEKTAGETSPGYMLLIALLYRALPAAAVPVALKLANAVAWYALCGLVYVVGRRLLEDRRAALAAAAAVALMPGSAYNANVGMENGLFAAAVWGWMALALRWGWFGGAPTTVSRELAANALLGAACWLRPEGLVVAALAHGARLAVAGRPAARRWLPGLAGAAVIAAAIAGLLAFHRLGTGAWLPTSALSRVTVMVRNAVWIGPVRLDPSFALRLAAYLPLTALAIVGARSLLRAPHPAPFRFLAVLFTLFFVLYSTVLGSAHLARYVIFLMPIAALAASAGAFELAGRRPRLVTAAALVLGLVYAGEAWVRLHAASPLGVRSAVAAPAQRTRRTDELLSRLGATPGRPVVLAWESVQARYWYDDRVVIRSLDGRVDRRLLRHLKDGDVDHVAYLLERGVDFLMETPSYNRHRDAWSLRRLDALRPGQAMVVDGLQFRRLEGRTPTFALTRSRR